MIGRSLRRFLHEEGPAGLFAHIEYDRLISEYVSLFGVSNVLVLPLEMLGSDPAEFFRRLSAFIGVDAQTAGRMHPSNTSTRHDGLLALFRPLNRLFSAGLWLMLLCSGRWPPAYHPRRKKIFPFMALRYRFYALKRRMTAVFNKRFPGSRVLCRDDIPGADGLEERFSRSNARLHDLGVIDWDMHAHGFAFPAESHR